MIGFDFSYRGNQNELIAEALGVCPAFEKLSTMPGATFIGNEPSLTLALDPECRMQCRVNVETRTNAYQIRTQDFQEEQVSVYVTARQYGSLSPDTTYVAAIERLARLAQEVVDGYVVTSVLEPLARAISLELMSGLRSRVSTATVRLRFSYRPYPISRFTLSISRSMANGLRM